MDSYDAVIIGGGIAGTALAAALAGRNHRVLVLERDTVYRDRGMGEYVQPWGVQALRGLGLVDWLRQSGSAVGTEFMAFEGYDGREHVGRVKRKPLDTVLPNVPGSLQIDHARVNAELTTLAASLGAEVLRGARLHAIRPGPPAVIDYSHNGYERTVHAALLVGADGRRSFTRSALGSDIEVHTARIRSESVLIDNVSGWPPHRNALGNHGDSHFILLGRSDDRSRLYRFRNKIGQQSGRTTAAELVVVAQDAAASWGHWLTRATPGSPAIAHDLSEGSCAAITAPGAVLIGDAAGWSNPLIGQGLSVVFDDVRRIVELVEAAPISVALAEFEVVRRRLLQRLSMSSWLASTLQCDFAPGAAARRHEFAELAVREPLLDVPLSSYVSGPLRADDAAFSPTNRERLRRVIAALAP